MHLNNRHIRCLIILSLSLLITCSFACTPVNRDKDNNVFRMAVSSEPPTLDWNLATDSISVRVIENIMEGFTQFDRDRQAVPAVASGWSVSGDGRTYIFSIRDSVHWSDGRKVTAYDFEYGWKRLLNPATASQYAYFLYDIVNAYEYNSGQLKDPSLLGVKALNNTELQVRLKRPVVYFPSLTAFTATFPLRRDIVEKYGDRWTEAGNIVTNGPFTLSEWRHEYSLTLSANRNYFGGRPRLDAVRFYVIGESTTALTLYETGGLDIVSLPPLAIPSYKNHREYVQHPLLRGYYYGVNGEDPPLKGSKGQRPGAIPSGRKTFPEILKGG